MLGDEDGGGILAPRERVGDTTLGYVTVNQETTNKKKNQTYSSANCHVRLTYEFLRELGVCLSPHPSEIVYKVETLSQTM